MQDISSPSRAEWVVTFDAVCAVACGNVVRVFRVRVIIIMTVEAVVAKAVKTQVCFRLVAVNAVQVAVGAHQRKSVLFMYFRNVAH